MIILKFCKEDLLIQYWIWVKNAGNIVQRVEVIVYFDLRVVYKVIYLKNFYLLKIYMKLILVYKESYGKEMEIMLMLYSVKFPIND